MSDEQAVQKTESGKEYTPLNTIAGAKIQQCSYLLPNSIQCWRASDYLVSQLVDAPATGDQPAEKQKREYQLCARHAVIMQAVDAGRMEPERPQVAQGTPVTHTPIQEGGAQEQKAAYEDAPKPLPQMAHNPDGPRIPVGISPAQVTHNSVAGQAKSLEEAKPAKNAAMQQNQGQKPVVVPAADAKNPPAEVKPVTVGGQQKSATAPTAASVGTKTAVQTPSGHQTSTGATSATAPKASTEAIASKDSATLGNATETKPASTQPITNNPTPSNDSTTSTIGSQTPSTPQKVENPQPSSPAANPQSSGTAIPAPDKK